MRLPRSQPLHRRLRADTRGATMTEYAIMLFLVLVVGASAWKVFGQKLDSGMGKTTSNLETQSDQPSGAGGAGGGGTAKSPGAGGTDSSGGGGGGGGGFGGARVAAKEQEGSALPKFALVALGIVGGAAAFFAMMKGKNAR